MFLGIFDIDEYVSIPAPTHRFSSGAAYAPTSLTYSIYEEGGTTGLDEDVDMTPASPFDSITGCYLSRRQLTADAGFERNKTYLVVVKATVDSVSAIDMHIFQIRTKSISTTDIRTAIGMSSANLDTQLNNILNEISYIGIGSGPTAKEYYVYVDNLPCADVLVVMTTDALGINKIHRGYTDASGLVTFYPDLSVGTTVYMWCYKTGVDFTNPDTEVI